MKTRTPAPVGSEKDEVICNCFQVKESTIRSAIAKGNLQTIEEVTEACEAGGGCHSCHILLQLFLDEAHNHLPSKKELVAQHGDKVQKKGVLSKFLSRFKSAKS